MNVPPIVDLLIIEDNPNDLELTLRALRQQGLANNVFTVKDGAEALEYIFQNRRGVLPDACPPLLRKPSLST